MIFFNVMANNSKFFETMYPGIVTQAVMLTFGTLGALLLAYISGLIKPTENFKLGIVAATGGIAFVSVILEIVEFAFVWDSGMTCIMFSKM